MKTRKKANRSKHECMIQEAELMQYLLGSPIIYDTDGRVYTIVDKTYPKAWKLGVERGH